MRTAKDVYFWQCEEAKEAGIRIVKLDFDHSLFAGEATFAEVVRYNIETWGSILTPRIVDFERPLELTKDEINQLKGIIEIAEALEEIRANP